MFSSVLFRKFFLSVLFIVLVFSIAIYFFSVPLIKRSLYRLEKESAQTILDNVYEIVRSEYLSIEAYKESALAGYKRQLKNILILHESFLKNKYLQYKEGLLTEEEAKNSALEETRRFIYGTDDYIWISDYNSVLISHPDPRAHKADYSLVRDKYGKRIVPSVVRIAREKNQGYTSYWWRRLSDEKFVEKLTYSRHFPQWKWVTATGVYIDDVETEVARRKKKMLEELREILQNVKIARTGYMYIFDSKLNMIVHPNPNIENTNFSNRINPVTNQPIGKEMIAVGRNLKPELFYKWDKPDDKGQYIYNKITWVRYFKEFDWYIGSSIYTKELNITSDMLGRRILIVSVVMFLISLGTAIIFLNKFLVPIKKLSNLALKAKEGDLSVRCHAAGNDEIGVLSMAFNSMITQLRNNIEDLDRKVHERTHELLRSNKQLIQEIEERTLAEDALRESEERYRTILENIEDSYYEVDLAGNMIFFNNSLCRHLGYTKDELEGTNFREYMDEINAKKVFQAFHRTFKTGKSAKSFDWKFIKKDGSEAYAEISVSLIKNSEGDAIGFRGIARDVTERKKFEEELAFLAYHDPLTGLYNRKAFLEKLKETLVFAKRYENERSVFYLDLDKFKEVNDMYGHETGDKLLKEVADRLKISVRESDHVCRFGGDEFTIILNNTNDSCPERVALRIMEKISEPYYIDNHKIDFITPSIGISAYPKDGYDVDTLINCADTAMYKAKEGRNQYVCYSKIKTCDS
ncbi:cache domain-containing protein [Desulfonema magnum]|nr:cache domain-containing protein [Desulfonema magnum]